MMSRFFLISCILLPMMAQAQTEFGIKGGVNVSDVVMTNYINPDVEADLMLKIGPHAGFFVTGVVAERLGLTAELLYSSKGVKANGNINLHYIAIPLLFDYRLSEKIFAQIGPELAYMVSATSDIGDASGTYNNKLDLGLDGGIRVDARRMTFGMRYCVGMFSVREPIVFTSTSGSEKIKYQNRVLQVFVGFKLRTLETPAMGRQYHPVRSRRYRGASSRG